MITCKSDYKDIRFFINEIIHFHLEKKDFIGMYSWIEGTNYIIYYIEIYTKDKDIKLEYDKKELWKTFLKLWDENM